MAINTKAPFTSAVVLTWTLLNVTIDNLKCFDGSPFVWPDAAELATKPNSPAFYPLDRTPSGPVTSTAAADVVSRRGQVPWPVNSQQLILWRLPK
jgi:hypothetical protein